MSRPKIHVLFCGKCQTLYSSLIMHRCKTKKASKKKSPKR